jgi:hypothetical protein
MILDSANALFKDDWLMIHDVPEEMIEQVTVGVDPSGGGDEVGIVACALLTQCHGGSVGLSSPSCRSVAAIGRRKPIEPAIAVFICCGVPDQTRAAPLLGVDLPWLP